MELRAPRLSGSVVIDHSLTYQEDAQEITISLDSPDWYAWLEQAHSFSFRGSEGSFTAHKARASNRRGGWYWYAYRRRHGQLLRAYLGSSSALTLERLRAAARQLADSAAEAKAEPPDSVETLRALPMRSREQLQASLLATSFHIPRLPSQHIARPRLLKQLEQGTQKRLTLVSAPAGSGKTTLLAAWTRATTLPVAWLSLENTDNDPLRFLSYLFAALKQLVKHSESADLPALQLSSGLSWQEVKIQFVNELARLLSSEVVLILDDYHLINNELIHEALRFILEHAPASLHLVIGTRSEPPLPLARLRAHSQLTAIGAEELRFSAPELRAFLAGMGYALSSAELEIIEQQTQGWVVGVHLLALTLGKPEQANALQRFEAGAHRFFLEYVSEEILAQQSEPVRTFLLRTSILERLTDPLCAAVADLPTAPLLADLQRANLLVHGLDESGTWYRYHPLFAEALRAHLHKQDASLVPELYLRASLWHEQQGCGELAYAYALRSDNRKRAANLLAELVPQLLVEGKLTRLSQWLQQLSPELIAASPSLSLASIWLQCQANNAPSLIAQLEEQLEHHPPSDDSPWAALQGELTLQRAWSALLQNDSKLSIALISRNLHAHLKRDSILSRLIAVRQRLILSTAYRTSGDLEAAERALLDTSCLHISRVDHLLYLLVTMELAQLYETQGQLRKLEQLMRKALRQLDRADRSVSLPRAILLARYAALLYEWDQPEPAEATVREAVEVMQSLDLSIPNFSLLCLWIQARLALKRGDKQYARQLLEREETSSVRFLPLDSMTLLQNTMPAHAILARLALAGGLLEHTTLWEKARGIRFDDPIVSHPLSSSYADYTTLARILLARGREQRDPLALTQALSLLERLRQAINGLGGHGWFIEIQMLTALVLQAQGKTKRALYTLGAVVAQAEPQGYIRLFADEGQPMAHLLAQLTPYTSASTGYLQRLQDAIVPTSPETLGEQPHVRGQLIEPLTLREEEILHLLAAGLSNQQIATRLVISLHTVKLHVKHILAKLTATNRTQAVTRARELHLL
ncbi:LuxR C-terminal-related transcriptional regulator [Ktedonosporobacter rubrisoli]|nr:LuxR C-terminal-related transcriptional regulator [Ktedonosporobacter rubrisoli]